MEYPSNGISQTSEVGRAVQAVIQDIASRREWSEEVGRGKMFGVLLAEDAEGRKHTLKAYSGQILGRSDWPGYVPAIYDYLQEDGYFKRHEAEITALNDSIRAREATLPKGRRTAEVEAMKRERKERSQALQRWLFAQFMLAGADGTEKSVLEVFGEYAAANGLKQVLPPGGTGECCAPKLLHYANRHNMRPLELAEFWYGASPKGEVRHHGQFYEPCQAKCQPILWHLAPTGHTCQPPLAAIQQGRPPLKILGGNPMQQRIPHLTPDHIIYEDAWFVAINKPSHLLSVPGKRQLPNAEDQLRELLRLPFLKMTHRLDMDTSGVLLAAKTPAAHEAMQRLFASHEEVRKEYEAILSTRRPTAAPDTSQQPAAPPPTGTISLPLAPDFMNRPRQCIDRERGKDAVTDYEFIATTTEGYTHVRLHPHTGRTHQLRLHCAHGDGLGMPILGDPLYGNVPYRRMCLHASKLTFTHPFTHVPITLDTPPPDFPA